MPYNLRASQAERLSSPTGRFIYSGVDGCFFNLLANPPPILGSAAKTSVMTWRKNDKRQTCGQQNKNDVNIIAQNTSQREFVLVLLLGGCDESQQYRERSFPDAAAGWALAAARIGASSGERDLVSAWGENGVLDSCSGAKRLQRPLAGVEEASVTHDAANALWRSNNLGVASGRFQDAENSCVEDGHDLRQPCGRGDFADPNMSSLRT